MQKINIWFHAAMMGSGYEITLEMLGRIAQSGLYCAAEHIYLSMVGDLAQQERLKVLLCDTKYQIIFQSEDVTLCEWPCLMHLRLNAAGSCLYCHSKGASNQNRQGVPPHIQNNIRTWRDCMSHFVIGKWEKCSRMVSPGNWDAVGALYDVNPRGKIFAGNFWWASERHIKMLPDKPDPDRNKAEEWVTSINGNFENLYTAPHKKDLYGFDGTEAPFGNYREK